MLSMRSPEIEHTLLTFQSWIVDKNYLFLTISAASQPWTKDTCWACSLYQKWNNFRPRGLFADFKFIFMKNVPPWPLSRYLSKKKMIMRECASIPLEKASLVEKDAAARWQVHFMIACHFNNLSKIGEWWALWRAVRAPRLNISNEIENQGHVIRSSLEMGSMNWRWSRCEWNRSVRPE